MKRSTIFKIILTIIALFVITYFLGEMGLLGGILTALGIGGSNKFKEQIEKLDNKAEKVKAEVAEIEKKREKLKKDGVEEKTSDEEVDYWKDQ